MIFMTSVFDLRENSFVTTRHRLPFREVSAKVMVCAFDSLEFQCESEQNFYLPEILELLTLSAYHGYPSPTSSDTYSVSDIGDNSTSWHRQSILCVHRFLYLSKFVPLNRTRYIWIPAKPWNPAKVLLNKYLNDILVKNSLSTY